MLDLSVKINNYKLKWFDGDVLEFKKPSQGFLLSVTALDGIEDTETQLLSLNKLVREMLNSNLNGRKFTEEDFGNLDLVTMKLILEDYLNSVYEELGE